MKRAEKWHSDYDGKRRAVFSGSGGSSLQRSLQVERFQNCSRLVRGKTLKEVSEGGHPSVNTIKKV